MRYQAPDLYDAEGTNKVPGRGFRVVLDTDHIRDMAELQSAYDNGYEVARAQAMKITGLTSKIAALEEQVRALTAERDIQMEEHCEDLGRARGDIRTLTAENAQQSETIERLKARLRSIGAKEEEHEPPYIDCFDCSVFENQKLCVGYAGGCDGDLTAMAHDDFCPARANDVILRPHLYSAQPAKGEEHA